MLKKKSSTTSKNHRLLSGNQAIAAACIDANVRLVSGYPGTPSTEIIETLKKTPKNQKSNINLTAHWAINEKVALELAIGVSFAEKRSVATMKHVGVNVAADALMTFSYTGVGGGCVLVSADDPNMYSSQNEQDNRNYAAFAKIPLLEPSSPQEAYHFLIAGLELSEMFDTPVLLRTTGRVGHATETVFTIPKKLNLYKGINKIAQQQIAMMKGWDKKKIMLPSFGRVRHAWVEERLTLLAEVSENFFANEYQPGKNTGSGKKTPLFITSGVSTLYIKEVYPDAAIFKVGMPYPAPTRSIAVAAKKHSETIVVEELDPFLENQLLIAGIKVRKRNRSFYCGELSPERTRTLVTKNEETKTTRSEEKPNPPMLCSGCPHLTIANLLREENLTVSGDIGCYTLAALPPFEALSSVLAMGASISIMNGMALAYDENSNKTMAPPKVAVIGDSTLLHAGLPALLDSRTLNPSAVICVLDNNTTAMTGRQEHPGVSLYNKNGSLGVGNGNNVKSNIGGKASLLPMPIEKKINYTKLAEAVGISNVRTVKPRNFQQTQFIFRKALKEEGLSLLVFEESCALLEKKQETVAEVNNNCVRCAECLSVGCPSIGFDLKTEKPKINEATCIGCGICYSSCDYEALRPKNEHTLLDFLKR